MRIGRGPFRASRAAVRCGILDGMPLAPAAPLPPVRDAAGPYRICCVCLGNICRSPMAEVVLRAELVQAGLAAEVVVDSAGTGGWHVGQRMYPGARAQLERSGYDGGAHRARQFEAPWLAERDLVLAMDAGNLADLQRLAPYYPNDPQVSAPYRLRLFGEVAGLGDVDVPDPYGGTPADFARVLAMLQKGMATLVARLPETLTGSSGRLG